MDGVTDNASLRFHKFRYPVTKIAATLHQRPLSPTASSMDDVILDVIANGMVGQRPVVSTGWIRFAPRGGIRAAAGMPIRYDIALPGCSGLQMRRVELNTVGRASVTREAC
jgi:hypothetical protein